MNVLGIVSTLCIVLFSGTVVADREVDCLAKTIYHVGHSQDSDGKQLIGQLVLNRVKSDKFPNTICEVVYQNGQFQWTVGEWPIIMPEQYDESVKIANELLNTKATETIPVLYYHHYLKPKPTMFYYRNQLFRHGDYIFYD